MNVKPPVPKKKDDSVADIEQQFILRLPPGTAMALRRDVQSGAMNLKDKLSIELLSDMRRSKVMYGGQIFPAKLIDLPCIIESLKTTDNKAFYKTADISQMLICAIDEEDLEDEQSSKKDKRYIYPHGITPGLKNVRKRRFRKTLKKKTSEMPDIEKEVKRLFRMDNEAIDVKWEVVIEEEQPADPQTAEKQVLAQGEASRVSDVRNAALAMQSFAEETLGEQDIFGDVSDSDNEDDDVTGPTDGDIMKEASKKIFGDVSDSDGEDKMDMSVMEGESGLEMSLSGQQALDYSMADSSMVTDAGELQIKLEELVKQVNEMRDKRRQLELEIETTDNYLLKERLTQEIQNLMEEESQKEKEKRRGQELQRISRPL